ncbi:MAG: hypothetical protein ACR9NN_02470 [Nostochopsis sp.]
MTYLLRFSHQRIAHWISPNRINGDIPGNIEEMYELRQWLMVDHFDRQKSQPTFTAIRAWGQTNVI